MEYARDHIGNQNDGENTINVDCINALISRFGLFEGTWQKYHNLSTDSEYNKYLQASFDASSELMKKYTELIPSYDAVFNSLSLAKNQVSFFIGIIRILQAMGIFIFDTLVRMHWVIILRLIW